jgi:hypothetical protein
MWGCDRAAIRGAVRAAAFALAVLAGVTRGASAAPADTLAAGERLWVVHFDVAVRDSLFVARVDEFVPFYDGFVPRVKSAR